MQFTYLGITHLGDDIIYIRAYTLNKNIDPQEGKMDNASEPTEKNELSVAKNRRTKISVVIGALICLGLFFRFFFGIFVIQPIGAIPEGVTILYWRSGLNIPFVASADGMLEASGAGVSLLGRAVFLGKMVDVIKERKIVSFAYSEGLYLWSTGGKKYEK